MKQHILIQLFKVTFLALFIGCLQVNGFAQTNIKVEGIVISKIDKLPIPGVSIIIKGTSKGTVTDFNGKFQLAVDSTGITLEAMYIGYKSVDYKLNNFNKIHIELEEDTESLEEVIVVAYGGRSKGRRSKKMSTSSVISIGSNNSVNTESYAEVSENTFHKVTKKPLSTFSVDVDRASYSNVRRNLNNGNLPPKDAVRIEEMINYFDYSYPQPITEVPFSINHELSLCPWNEENLLLKIGLQGVKMERDELPSSNIVFLIDVSGSMSNQNKLPLLKSSFKMLLNNLNEKDRVAIVVYAGSSGLKLPSTKCSNKAKIIEALDNLEAGGSTAGGEGLKLAYKVAKQNFIKKGNNRIILATDGDFNVGVSSNEAMEELITERRDEGIAISVLGFGMGNYQDDKMEIIADKGNGNYAYIDNLQEAQKVLVKEFGGTLMTIAKDVKFQLEFNPKFVAKYRLIGYENRLLEDEDFDDDKKDAGEIGAGHSVTALYEIVPVIKKTRNMSELKYQSTELTEYAKNSNDLLTLKLRYKQPTKSKSNLIETVVKSNYKPLSETTTDFKFTASIAEFGMLLRNSEFKGSSSWDTVIQLAKEGRGTDEEGYRSEMIRLLKVAKSLDVKYENK
ncbi:vWA domain-containing protein [Flammeovirga kamogawensis]|nr:VWA domain-containing protein [Flammeovirga kamogawensis]MBB6462247.1 Ca-activated chloride channel family protein [Flammeovirga kamogawensis]TRX64875.1 DUF3520 domain-containing protein [Flammeovirga kamogawensis]